MCSLNLNLLSIKIPKYFIVDTCRRGLLFKYMLISLFSFLFLLDIIITLDLSSLKLILLLFVCLFVCMYVCMYVHTYVRMYVRTYVCTYVCMYVCTYVCTYVCMYVRMYVRTYVCIYRVIKNGFRGFNNLSYTINLKYVYMYFLFNRTTFPSFCYIPYRCSKCAPFVILQTWTW